MKSLALLALLFMSCQEAEVNLENSPLEGEWKLVKIINGFAQIEQSAEQLGYTKTLEIKSSFKTWKDGQMISELGYTLETQHDQDAIILSNQTYHWYSFVEENGEKLLVLYENCPVEAILADGSNYYYTKVK